MYSKQPQIMLFDLFQRSGNQAAVSNAVDLDEEEDEYGAVDEFDEEEDDNDDEDEELDEEEDEDEDDDDIRARTKYAGADEEEGDYVLPYSVVK